MNQEEINAKARELVEKYMLIIGFYPNAKQCALIDIQNTIDMLRGLDPYINLSCYNLYLDEIVKHQLIKQAIESL